LDLIKKQKGFALPLNAFFKADILDQILDGKIIFKQSAILIDLKVEIDKGIKALAEFLDQRCFPGLARAAQHQGFSIRRMSPQIKIALSIPIEIHSKAPRFSKSRQF
jgi:hypothetical protein